MMNKKDDGWTKIVKQRFEEMFRVQSNYLFINEKKKATTIVLWNGAKRVVKCDKNDKFNWKIGFALCIERCWNATCDKKRYAKMRELFTDKKGNLDYERYAEWLINDMFNYNFNEEDFISNKYPGWKVKFYK